MYEFKMPSMGADMDKAKLVEWNIRPGSTVKKGDIIATIETTKSAVQVEAWRDGVVEKILVEPGEEDIPVGTVLALIRTSPDEKIEEAPPAKPAPEPKVSARRVSPAARKLAAELHVDLEALKGSGPEGAITLEDVRQKAASIPPDKNLLMRRAIASAMEKAHREIPSYYLETTVLMEKALSWLTLSNQSKPPPERLLSVVLLLKAVALAVKQYPEFNGFYIDGAFKSASTVNVGVAVSLREGGLMAPALLDADKKNLSILMSELADLTRRVRERNVKSSELLEATITVTNLGETGVERVFGLIYPPQVALVGFGRIYEAPVCEGGAVKCGRVISASLSADHRASDGHRGALFLSEISRLLQEPENL